MLGGPAGRRRHIRPAARAFMPQKALPMLVMTVAALAVSCSPQQQSAAPGRVWTAIPATDAPPLPIPPIAGQPPTAPSPSAAQLAQPRPSAASARSLPQATAPQARNYSAGLGEVGWFAILDTQMHCRESLLSSGGFRSCDVDYTLGFSLPPEGSWNISYSCDVVLSTIAPGDFMPARVTGWAQGFLSYRSGYATTFGTEIVDVGRMLGEGPVRVRLTDFTCRARRSRTD